MPGPESRRICAGASSRPQVIFGVTGSGKTELYLARDCRDACGRAQQAIYLVPEIALTTQIAQRVTASGSRAGRRPALGLWPWAPARRRGIRLHPAS